MKSIVIICSAWPYTISPSVVCYQVSRGGESKPKYFTAEEAMASLSKLTKSKKCCAKREGEGVLRLRRLYRTA